MATDTERAIFIATLLVLLALVLMGLWDVVLIWSGQPTVSDRIRAIAGSYPMFPFTAGLVCGLLAAHFFWWK